MLNSEKRETVDLDAFLKHASTIRNADAAPSASSDRAGGVSPLARRVAEQLRGDGLTPAIVVGQFRLFEFFWLVAISLAVFYFAPDSAGLSLTVQALAATVVPAFAILALQITDSYQIRTL